jgi:hypothetical protein
VWQVPPLDPSGSTPGNVHDLIQRKRKTKRKKKQKEKGKEGLKDH